MPIMIGLELKNKYSVIAPSFELILKKHPVEDAFLVLVD